MSERKTNAADRLRPRGPWSDWLWVTLAVTLVAVGAYYRVRDFPHLILLGDEKHALRAASLNDLAQCFVYYAAGDSGIPLNLYARVLLVAGVLDELTMRLPMIVSGLVVLCAPLLFARRLGRPTTLIALALFATSPGLTYFSFVARPYALTMLLLLIAFWGWDRWYRTRTRASFLTFNVCAGLAVFVHIFALFGVAAMYVSSLVGIRREEIRWRELFAGAAISGGIVLVLLGPGLPNMLATKTSMVAGSMVHAGYPVAVWHILTGFLGGSEFVLAAGIASWLRRELHMGLAGLALVGFQAGALALLRPDAGPAAYFRWALPPWPILLLFMARGFEALVYRLSRASRRELVALAIVVALAGLVTRFPLAREHSWRELQLAARPWFSPWVSWAAGIVYAAALARFLLTGLSARPEASPHSRDPRSMPPGSPASPAFRAVGYAFAVAFALLYLERSQLRLFSARVDSFRTQRQALGLEAPLERTPAVFRRLADDPSTGGVILATPLLDKMGTWTPHTVYQRRHGKRIVFADAGTRPPGHYRSGLRNVVPLREREALRRTGARYLVLHLFVESEYRYYGRERLISEEASAQYDALASAARIYLREACGDPVLETPRFELYDLREWLAAE